MFRVAIFSDIHGNLEALNSILSNIEKDEFDEIVCLGDVIGLGPDSKECLDLIIKYNIKLVLGNHERYYLNGTHNELKMTDLEKQHHEWIARQLGEGYKEYLSKKDIYIQMMVNDQKIAFMHYPFDKVEDNFYTPKMLTEESVKRMFRNYSDQFTFFGHSHHEQFFKATNGRIYFNIPSVGCGKEDTTSYTIFEYDGKDFNIYKKKCIYDRIQFEQELEKIEYPGKEFIINTFF
jgi:predicted phosphodiesterase